MLDSWPRVVEDHRRNPRNLAGNTGDGSHTYFQNTIEDSEMLNGWKLTFGMQKGDLICRVHYKKG